MTARNPDATLGFPLGPQPASWLPGRPAALATAGDRILAQDRAASGNFSQAAAGPQSPGTLT